MTNAPTPEQVAMAIYDKTGREIMQGDILKVFHFVGRRWGKHHYMYKQVVCENQLGKKRNRYWFLSHLNQTDEGYHLPINGDVLLDYEIVQSTGADFEDRPRQRELVAASLRARSQGNQHD